MENEISLLSFLSVTPGTKKHMLDILLKCSLPSWLLTHISLPAEYFCYFLYRCAFIMKRSIKCSSVLLKSLRSAMKNCCAIWFSFIFRPKSKFKKKLSVAICEPIFRKRTLSSRWFDDTANIYSSFVLIQLICSVAIMTVSVFYLDLVWRMEIRQ